MSNELTKDAVTTIDLEPSWNGLLHYAELIHKSGDSTMLFQLAREMADKLTRIRTAQKQAEKEQ